MRYNKPAGYNTLWLINGVKGQSYKLNNGFLSGNERYAPSRYGFQVSTLTFSAAPADGSQITVPDGPAGLKTFTFTYGGAPGAGIIPLVGGGGTAAQAATATQVALEAQLSNWTATNPSAGITVLTSKIRGYNLGVGLVGNTHITISLVLATLTQALPARFGRSFCFLANTTSSSV
jgi:hypothetical protein